MKRYGRTVCRSHSIPEVELLHIVGDDLESLIGSPEDRRAEIVRTLTEAAHVNPMRLAERRAALADVTAKLQEGARRFLDVPSALAGEITAAMEALKVEQLRLTEEVKSFEGDAVDPARIDALADAVVSHLRILRCHLVAGERLKVRTIVQRFVERIVIAFDRSASRLDVVESVRIKYREDAFTTRALVAECATLLAETVNKSGVITRVESMSDLKKTSHVRECRAGNDLHKHSQRYCTSVHVTREKKCLRTDGVRWHELAVNVAM